MIWSSLENLILKPSRKCLHQKLNLQDKSLEFNNWEKTLQLLCSRLANIENKLVAGGGEGKTGVGDEEVRTIIYKINQLQRYIVPHREYSQYFTITTNGV